MRLLFLSLLAALAVCAAVPAAASADSCKSVRKGVKRCEAVKKQVCVSGDPTVCRRSRSVCEQHKSGWFRCRYVAKYARCRGLNGARCQTTWTRCDTVPGRKRCTTNQLESCRTRKDGSRKCYRKFDDCTTRSKGRYSCTNTYTQRDCPKSGPCVVFRKVCRARNGMSRAECRAVKYTEDQSGAPPPAPADESTEPPPPSDPDAGAPPPS